jgi:hypothetical protein
LLELGLVLPSLSQVLLRTLAMARHLLVC